jgi:dUTP pyrophosphatase
MKIYIKKIDGLTIPERGSQVAAGYDIIATNEPKIIGRTFDDVWGTIDYIEYETNLFIAPSAVTFHTLIHPRSSISKYNLVLANSIGLVDNDYRGMVICRFKYVWQPEDYIVRTIGGSGNVYGKLNIDKIYKKGDKIAQLVFEPTVQVEFETVDDLSQTRRGSGGFGSTDVKSSPVGTTRETIPISNREGIITKIQPLPGIKPKKDETTENKHYESKVDILEKWKSTQESVKSPINYETLIREREKSI